MATTTTTGVISGEMFTESSMDIQAVTFPGKNFFGFDLGYDKGTISGSTISSMIQPGMTVVSPG